VYRYIDELSLADVPIYNVRGRNGGYAISDTYKIPATFLTDEESEKIIATLTQINNELGSNVIETAITKLSAVSKNGEETLSLNLGNLIIDGTAWGTVGVYTETLKLIQQAIESKNLVTISYVNREGEASERVIEPHLLALKQGLWYTYAYCTLRKEFRLFKVGRIEKAKLSSETFTRREIEKINEIFSKWYAEEPEDVDFIVDKLIKADVEEWLGVNNVSVQKDGTVIASTKLPINDYLTAKILSFGDKIKVIAPKKLKTLVINKAKAIEELYK
jgi:predicted DNA-binding transcriptional regulator YafY